MRRLVMLLPLLAGFCFTSSLPAADAKDTPKVETTKPAPQPVQGSWRVIKRVKNGQVTPEKQTLNPKVVLTFDGAALSERKGDEEPQLGGVTFDDTKSPPRITMTGKTGPHAGQAFTGIYQISGDTLKIAYSLKAAEPPADFEGGEGAGLLVLERVKPEGAATPLLEIKPPTEEQAKEYTLDPAFYKKCSLAENVLIATSAKVTDYTHREAGYLFRQVMKDIRPDVAQRIRDRKVLCVIVGHDELVTDLPQWHSTLTGKELHFYNWRNRGFLEMNKNGRPTFLFSEEDVMEYEGGMRAESILIHEFGHVIQGAGFDKDLTAQLTEAYENAKKTNLWRDGYAAQKFKRVKSETPVSLLEALVKAFPAQEPAFLKTCMDAGDILVNGKPADSGAKVTKKDKVLIVFGGPKDCYARLNKAEYWAEAVQCWYDCGRTNDHDHNHIHTREGIKQYDPKAAKLLAAVFGDREWRFVSPRDRAGKDHLAGYDPEKSPKVELPEDIDNASQDYYDEYWKSYWGRLHEKHATAKPAKDQKE